MTEQRPVGDILRQPDKAPGRLYDQFAGVPVFRLDSEAGSVIFCIVAALNSDRRRFLSPDQAKGVKRFFCFQSQDLPFSVKRVTCGDDLQGV